MMRKYLFDVTLADWFWVVGMVAFYLFLQWKASWLFFMPPDLGWVGHAVAFSIWLPLVLALDSYMNRRKRRRGVAA